MTQPDHPLRHRFVAILGTNEIASAIAVYLSRVGATTVMSNDPDAPVMRRKMAFHDALFDEGIAVEEVSAQAAFTTIDVIRTMSEGRPVTVTPLGLLDLMTIRTFDLLIDARMQKYQTTPDLRHLAFLTIGLGPSFSAGCNCDVAIETSPDQTGQILASGPTKPADGRPRPLGGHGEERFARAEAPGRWHTAVEIGTRVYRDFIIGHIADQPLRAAFDGVLRGVIRDGTEVLPGTKLFELDARGRKAEWQGIDERGQRIAAAVIAATAQRGFRLRFTPPALVIFS